MNVSVHFNDQCSLVTVEIDNKAANYLLSPKMDSLLIGPQFLPENLLGRRHIAAEFFCALEFLLRYLLTWDDVFDRHEVILL